MRALGLKPEADELTDRLPLAGRAILAQAALRAYRSLRPRRIGDRCAFDPSCSRYSELSFRIHGWRVGFHLTLDRLRRCRGQAGGLEMPPAPMPFEISKKETLNG